MALYLVACLGKINKRSIDDLPLSSQMFTLSTQGVKEKRSLGMWVSVSNISKNLGASPTRGNPTFLNCCIQI